MIGLRPLRYLDFTTQLELEVTNTAARGIALGKIRASLPDIVGPDAVIDRIGTETYQAPEPLANARLGGARHDGLVRK